MNRVSIGRTLSIIVVIAISETTSLQAQDQRPLPPVLASQVVPVPPRVEIPFGQLAVIPPVPPLPPLPALPALSADLADLTASLDQLTLQKAQIERAYREAQRADLHFEQAYLAALRAEEALLAQDYRVSMPQSPKLIIRDVRDSQEDRSYERGRDLLYEHKYEQAIEQFSKVVAMAGSRVDGALYWKASAQHRLGQRSEALATLEQLRTRYPQSRWLPEAKALEVEVRQASGQRPTPEMVADEDLKLIAINTLMQVDAERAMPMLQKILVESGQSPKVKERALFVVSQNKSPQAREIIAQIARGKGNPDLQMTAIRYLGLYGGKENGATLVEIYRSTPDESVKRAVLRSFMVSGNRGHLYTAARSEAKLELRGESVRQLGAMGAQDELWQLYQAESSKELRQQILRALFVSGNSARLLEVARTDRDAELRREAVNNLGKMGKNVAAGDALVSLYSTEKDPDVRQEVIRALFIQNNATALVQIARKETDPQMKKEVVRRLSTMKSKEAVDYLLELLNK